MLSFRLGVAANPRSAGLYLKGTKANQLDLVAIGQGCGDHIDSGVDSSLAILLGTSSCLLGNSIDQLGFCS